MTAEEVGLAAALIVAETLEANGFVVQESDHYPKPMLSHFVLVTMRRGLNPSRSGDTFYIEFFSDYVQILTSNNIRDIQIKYLDPDFDRDVLKFLDVVARKPRGMQEKNLHDQQTQGGG